MSSENNTEKAAGPSKSFMTAGPTLHYSHSNVHKCWWLGVGVYALACIFWSKITTGSMSPAQIEAMLQTNPWSLGQLVSKPLSIYEYPWQIVVLSFTMGILSVIPVVVSQLYSFRYSLIMILSALLLAKLPLLAGVLLISCIAVACRPLRFRSRFIAIALCMAPQILYWALLGGSDSNDSIQWGLSFAPWIGAWLTGTAIAGTIIGIGHYTRYKPGLVWIVSGVLLAIAVAFFQSKVGFDELDYQHYVAKNNPEDFNHFHDHQVTKTIDEALKDKDTTEYLSGLFYPSDQVLLRQELKEDIAIRLGYYGWPGWFKVPDELKYQPKKDWLLIQYDIFIKKWPNSKRVPVALYYKAILSEYKPDIKMFEQHEVLRFYDKYPHIDNLPIWYELFKDFSERPESLEARWRIAMHRAGKGAFNDARELCRVTDEKIETQIKALRQDSTVASNSLLRDFREPEETVMTVFKLQDLQLRVRQLNSLINSQNISDDEQSQKRLAQFVILNPYSRGYGAKLEELLTQTKDVDPLRDNILLAVTLQVEDTMRRAQQLEDISNKYGETDGGMQALYELGVDYVKMWKEIDEGAQLKKEYLSKAREILARFIKKFPDSIFRAEAQRKLSSLPTTD